MQWTDKGIVLGVRRHGEASVILELMTREHGRHLGLVRGGAGARMRPILQPGNHVDATWRARLDEHLGNYTVEGLDLPAASFLGSAHTVYGVTHLGALCRLLPERDPHPEIHAVLADIIARLSDIRAAARDIICFELRMLSELGFGLDLETCAATGTHTELAYVSPKSGRAVSRVAGEPWQDRLFRLPAFLREPDVDVGPVGILAAVAGDVAANDVTVSAPGANDITLADLADGFAITGFFLQRHVFEPRGVAMPETRASFFNTVMNACRADRIAS
jgi:DNA repair protein RecO (recombination protein O)